MAEADEQRTQRFYNLARTQQPHLARVDKVESEDYTGDIMPLWQTAAMNTSTHMNEAIPLLLDMNGKMTMMLEKQGQTIEEIKGLR